MPQINQTTNQFTFSTEPLNISGWETVDNETWNNLIAGGWTPTQYVVPYRVSKDTIVSRILEANKINDLITTVGGLPADQKFLWDNFAWFWSDNSTVIALANQINLDPNVILAEDPYL